MLTIDECLDMSGLTNAEIDAIAEHEHVPEIVAAEIGSHLLGSRDGLRTLYRFINDDIRLAREHGDSQRAAYYGQVLDQFVRMHPECLEAS